MSLQTGTLDSRSLAYFSCHPAAKSDYYLTVLGEWALVGFFFPLPVCSRLDVTECFRMHAAAGGGGGAFVWVWLSFLCAIKSAWFGETVDFLIQSLTTEHTFMTNCIILALRSEHLLFLLSLMVVSPFLRNKVCVRAHLYTRTRFPAALLSGLDISYRFSYINAVWCPVGRSTQCEGWGLSKQLVQRLTTSANRSSINKRNDNRLWGNMLT